MTTLKCLMTCLFLFMCFTSCVTHKDLAKAPEPEFASQGEQEDYWAKKLFSNQYQQQNIKKFKGLIQTIGSDTIEYNNTFIVINNPELKKIFTTGLLYPEIIDNQNFTVSNLEEQSFLNPSIKIKRFKFLLRETHLVNPIVYFFELTNNKATNKTSLANFIKDSKLTFIKQAWIDI